MRGVRPARPVGHVVAVGGGPRHWRPQDADGGEPAGLVAAGGKLHWADHDARPALSDLTDVVSGGPPLDGPALCGPARDGHRRNQAHGLPGGGSYGRVDGSGHRHNVSRAASLHPFQCAGPARGETPSGRDEHDRSRNPAEARSKPKSGGFRVWSTNTITRRRKSSSAGCRRRRSRNAQQGTILTSQWWHILSGPRPPTLCTIRLIRGAWHATRCWTASICWWQVALRPSGMTPVSCKSGRGNTRS